jgi:hypothetical protein
MKAREESMSRKDIMDRINKWLAACDEETWLEEYNNVNNFCYNFTCYQQWAAHASSFFLCVSFRMKVGSVETCQQIMEIDLCPTC